MISRYAVWLNDVSLAGIDPDIYIVDVGYTAVSRQYTTSRLAANDGAFAGNEYVQNNRISVSFMVRKYDTAERQRVIQSIIDWCADGGWVKTSDRIGQRIYCKTTRFPSAASVMGWTDVLVLEFTAYDYPFWTEETASTVVELNSGDSTQVYYPCGIRSDVEAVVTAQAAISAMSITVGDTTFAFANLGVSSGSTINIRYTDDHHILEVKSGNVSLLDKRTAASDDRLIAEHGINNVSFTASGSATCKLLIKGVYL